MHLPRDLDRPSRLGQASASAPASISAGGRFCEGSALCFSRVSFGYGDARVLDDLSFSIPHGEVVCLLGASGCGKTTVLRLVAGLERVSGGQIFLNGREVCSRDSTVAVELRSRACDIGMVFQDFALFPHLTIRENLALAAKREASGKNGFSGDDFRVARTDFEKQTIDERIASTLEMVELEDYAESYPHCLSGGQQQRVALARAIVSNPRLLLLDEPFANLDVRLRDRIRDRTLHLLQSLRCSVLLVSHDAEEGMYMANRLFVMDRRGSLVQSGTPQDVYGNPRDVYVASLLSEVNRFSVAIEGGEVSTPFGRYEVSFAGKRAEVVIRPQSLELSPIDNGSDNCSADTATGVVEAARLIGGYSLIHLSSCLPASSSGVQHSGAVARSSTIAECEHDCEPVHLHARVAGCFLPERGKRLRIAVKRSDVFLFAEKKASNNGNYGRIEDVTEDDLTRDLERNRG